VRLHLHKHKHKQLRKHKHKHKRLHKHKPRCVATVGLSSDASLNDGSAPVPPGVLRPQTGPELPRELGRARESLRRAGRRQPPSRTAHTVASAGRARSHCRLVLPLIHFITEPLSYSTKIIGVSISATIMRPNPKAAAGAGRTDRWCCPARAGGHRRARSGARGRWGPLRRPSCL
jgi:hypothetical protein